MSKPSKLLDATGISDSDRARFYQSVDSSSPGCWPWIGGSLVNGYGSSYCASIGGNVRAHRLAYALARGPIPPGMHVCHTCDNRACCNPDHLWLGTNIDNIADRHNKGRSSGPGRAGRSHPRAKLSPGDVQAIRALHLEHVDRRTIARAFGMSYDAVKDIINGRRWKHIKASD